MLVAGTISVEAHNFLTAQSPVFILPTLVSSASICSTRIILLAEPVEENAGQYNAQAAIQQLEPSPHDAARHPLRYRGDAASC